MANTVRELIVELQALTYQDAPVFLGHENPYGTDEVLDRLEIIKVQPDKVILSGF